MAAIKNKQARSSSRKRRRIVNVAGGTVTTRDEQVSRAISALSWSDLSKSLTAPTRGPGRAPANALREYFGPDEFEHLQQLARFNQTVRSHSAILGNVIFLHGITGSDLGAAAGSADPSNIWISLRRLVAGHIERLKLALDGAKEADSAWRVVPTGVNKRYYARAILALGTRWNVTPFAFDWRKDIDESSNELARLIRKEFDGKPVHLVAHSMGGLVCRNFIRLHPRLWEGMNDPEQMRGGRLIMLGTPNYGSYSIPQVIAGQDKMIGLLAALDLKHDLAGLLEVTNTFVGSYLMLPAPSKLPPDLHRLYRSETWGRSVRGVSQRHLDRAFAFHRSLEAASTIDPARMIYIAGCRHATLSGLKIGSGGDFDYQLTYAGDGRVPHELGILNGVPAYYIDEVHGDLARNEKVIAAVDEILERGTTGVLGTEVLRTLARGVPTMREYRTAEDSQLMEDLWRLARRAEEDQQYERARHRTSGRRSKPAAPHAAYTDEEARFAEDAIVKAALGSHSRPASRASLPPKTAKVYDRTGPLRINLHYGDITGVKAPLLVVGHYKGVPPTRAVGAIDIKLNHWIERAGRLGMIGGNLGETFFIPTVANALKAGGVVLGGMGEFGKFTRADLVLLMSNVTIGVSALGLASFASVLIGTGEGNLDRETALRAFLEGVATGADQFERESELKAVRTITLVEKNRDYFEDLQERIANLQSETGRARGPNRGSRAESGRVENDSPFDVELGRITRARVPASRRPTAAARLLPRTELEEVRLTVEKPRDGTFRFSALAETAVVPVKEVEINETLATSTAERLMGARTQEEQIKFGELLYTYLVPEELHRMIEGPKPLKLILDRSTASYPWEMACFRSTQHPSRVMSLGSDQRMTRQFRTLLSGAPGIRPALNQNIRVLVIADPAADPDLQLPGARREGREVASVFRNFPAKEHGISIEVVEHIGPDQCDHVEVLAGLLSGQFDIVHYAGHGDYDQDNPARSGWIFGKDCVLSARDIFRARKVPRLVFANACFSASTYKGRALTFDERSQGLASIAQAFFERGINNYIGSGWPVDDEQATRLARAFYENLLTGKTISKALHTGRAAIADYGNTWGAYQHYGNANDVVVRIGSDPDR